MSAKRTDTRGGTVPNKLRWADVNTATLLESAETLQMHAAALQAAADGMKELGVDEIRVDSGTKFVRANDLLLTYLAKVEMAIISAKYGQR